jgi:hypothetical protein
MMNTRHIVKREWIAIMVIVVSLVFLNGCQDQKAGVGLFGQRTSADKGELIVGWGEARKLNVITLKADFDAKGLPGGGKDEEVTMMVFYRSDGRAFIADMNGAEVLPCAQIVDGTIVPIGDKPACPNLSETKIIGVRENVTINTHKSPDCPIRSFGGYLIQRCP